MAGSGMERAMRRQVLLGLVQVVAGCLVGAIPPSVAAHYRSIGSSHVLLTGNGVLQAVVGLCMPLMDLPAWAVPALEALLTVGTWTNGLALLASGLSGNLSPLAAQGSMKAFPAPVVTERCMCHVLLTTCGPTILGALAFAIVGVVRGGRGSNRSGPHKTD